MLNTWALNYATKSLHYVSGSAVDTVKDLYKWVMDEIDELVQFGYDVPIKYDTPTEYQLINGWTIPATDYQYLKGGAITVNKVGGNDVYANIYTIGTIEAGTQLYVLQNGSAITPWWSTGHIDILVKVRADGVLIDSGTLVIFARELSDKFDNFQTTITGGRNAIPLATEDDINNQTSGATLAGYNDITITFGTAAKNLNNGNGAVNYDVVIDCATRSLSQVYEYLKYITRRGSTTNLNGVNGQFYRYANAAYSEIKGAPFGTFAGGKFFGARGVWIENYDANDAKNFQLIDAAGATQTPPNVVPVKVTGVVSGDRVAVFRLDGVGGEIDKTMYTYNLAGSTFTLAASHTPYSNNADLYIPLLDTQASSTTAQTTLTYSSDIPVLVVVRRYGILPFEVESTVGNVGMSVAAIRTTDTIAV